ncbi:MAG: hypothetical protein Ct9H300mP11_13920 [Chloroflexota bacterium]|nr:MAG: hypothetical protein Ct9H300mP11_13920 [Chloroflexota bacterium]
MVLDGAFHVAHAAMPNMAKNEYGRIVFFTVTAPSMDGHAIPCFSSQDGRIGLARGLASQFALKTYG